MQPMTFFPYRPLIGRFFLYASAMFIGGYAGTCLALWRPLPLEAWFPTTPSYIPTTISPATTESVP